MIKTAKTDIETSENYPILKISQHGNIVLFSTKHCGTIVHCCNPSMYTPGYYATSWSEEEFSIYTGSISLSNK